MQRTTPRENRNFLPIVQDLRGLFQINRIGQHGAAGFGMGGVMRNIPFGTLSTFDFHFLKVHRERQVADRAIGKRGAYGQICDVLHVCRTHDPLIERRNIHIQPVEPDILLGKSSNQIVKLQPGNGKYRLAVHLGIV